MFAGPRIKIIYTDGTCLNCQYGTATRPGFVGGGGEISFIQGKHVTLDGIDGLRRRRPGVGVATDAVWSASGKLAIVRNAALWTGRPGKLERIAAATDPSWSPDADRIAAVERGWVVIVTLRDHHVQRLAPGSAPAYSPDGRWIAFVSPEHRLMIVASHGGRAKPVGHVRAVSIDWQPKPRRPAPGCGAPPGSRVLASDPRAIITARTGPPAGASSVYLPSLAYMGCLRADGRVRLLERFVNNTIGGAFSITSTVLAPPYAALVERVEDQHYGGSRDTVQVFDLRTGRLDPGLGGESAGCPGYIGGACSVLDQILLGSDGVSAAHWQVSEPVGGLSYPLGPVACAPASTLCVAMDQRTGGFLTSEDPAGGREGWSSSQFTMPRQLAFSELACPSQTLCVAAFPGIYASSDPAGGAATWTPVAVSGGASAEFGLSCPSVSLCVVPRLDGSIATSTDPARSWKVDQIGAGRPLGAVICSSAPRCFIPDSRGTVYTSTDPAGGAGAWTVSATTPPFTAGACPTTSLCVTVNGQQIAVTTNPDIAAWNKQSLGATLTAVSCPSASLCVAVGAQGALDLSTDPASDTWTQQTIDHGLRLTSITCPSTSLCVATDANGHVVVSTNPAGGPSAWTPTLLEGDPCADATPCTIERIYASDKNGNRILDSREVSGSGPFLTGLELNGDTLSWSHDGTPRNVTLTPP